MFALFSMITILLTTSAFVDGNSSSTFSGNGTVPSVPAYHKTTTAFQSSVLANQTDDEPIGDMITETFKLTTVSNISTVAQNHSRGAETTGRSSDPFPNSILLVMVIIVIIFLCGPIAIYFCCCCGQKSEVGNEWDNQHVAQLRNPANYQGPTVQPPVHYDPVIGPRVDCYQGSTTAFW